MTRCDPVDPENWTGDPAKPGQKPDCNPLTFVFFTKTTPFWNFFKIEIDPANPVKTRWTGQNPKSRFKNYDSKCFKSCGHDVFVLLVEMSFENDFYTVFYFKILN